MTQNLVPYTYNGTDINDGTNYQSKLLLDDVYGDTTPVWSDRAWTDPKLSSKRFGGKTIQLQIILVAGTFDTMVTLFDKYDTSTKILIVKDKNDSDRQWFIYVTPIAIKSDGRTFTVTLAVDEPVSWQSVLYEDTSDGWLITTSDSSTDLPTVLGNTPAKPIIHIIPTSNRASTSSGFIYKMHVPIYSTSSNGAIDYPVCLTHTGASTDTSSSDFDWNHATEVSLGRSLASGNDVKVFVDGSSVDRWADGWNATHTRLWVNLNFNAAQAMTLKTPIASTDTTITSIVLNSTSDNLDSLNMISQKTGVGPWITTPITAVELMIDSELFYAQSCSPVGYIFYNITRAANGTAAASHAANSQIRWIEHDINICYGDLGAGAPSISDTKKPIIDLDTSTNETHQFNLFTDTTRQRTGGWVPTLEQQGSFLGLDSEYYTGSHTALANPATEMGMSIYSFIVNNISKGADGRVCWYYFNPYGFTTVAGNGYTRLIGDADAQHLGLEKTNDDWATVSYIGAAITFTSDSAWHAFSTTDVALGATYYTIRAINDGTTPAIASQRGDLEYTDATISGISGLVVTMLARDTTYEMDCTLTNTSTSDSISFIVPTNLNSTIVIVCSQNIAYLPDGRPIGIKLNTVRHDWFNLQVGANSVTFGGPGTAGVSVGFQIRHRRVL